MQHPIAFSVRLALSVVVFGMAVPVLAQQGGGGHPPRGGTPRNNTPHTGTPPRNAAAPQEEVEPAEPEEGPPEKKYDSLPVDLKLKREGSKIAEILRDGKFPTPDAKDDFDNFYNNYFLSRWSVQEDAKHLVEYRGNLSSHFRTAKPGQARDELTRLALDFLKKLVVGDYHPAVRINAMLAIGEINSVEKVGTTPAVPLPEALDVMIAAVNSSDSGKFPAGVRAAALVGILRHAWAGIPTNSDAQKKVNDAMLRLAVADVPAGSTPSVHAWMAAQAVETLGALGSVGENSEVFTAMLKLVADAKLPFLARCVAANAMGRLNYSSADGINPVETAAALGRLAADACKDGLVPPKDSASAGKEWPATMKYTETAAFRRRMVRRLDTVLLALGGVEDDRTRQGIASLAKGPPQQAFIAALQKAIKEAVDELDYKKDPHIDLARDPNVKLDDMQETVAKLQGNLEQILQKKP